MTTYLSDGNPDNIPNTVKLTGAIRDIFTHAFDYLRAGEIAPGQLVLQITADTAIMGTILTGEGFVDDLRKEWERESLSECISVTVKDAGTALASALSFLFPIVTHKVTR